MKGRGGGGAVDGRGRCGPQGGVASGEVWPMWEAWPAGTEGAGLMGQGVGWDPDGTGPAPGASRWAVRHSAELEGGGPGRGTRLRRGLRRARTP